MRPVFIKLFLLWFLLAGFSPDNTNLFAQQAKQQSSATRKKQVKKKQPQKTTKKSRSKKKKPTKRSTKKQPVNSRKKPSSGAKRSAPAPSSQSPAKRQAVRPATRKPQPVRKAPAPPAQPVELPPAVNLNEYSTDLFLLNEKLESSSRQLNRATKFMEASDRKKVSQVNATTSPSIMKLENQVFNQPGDKAIARELALEYEKNREYEKAKDIYLRMIARDPLNPDAHYYLGKVYESLGDTKNAQQAYEEALDLDNDHPATLNALSGTGRSAKKTEMSQELLSRASRNQPGGPAGRIKIIQDKIGKREFDQALGSADEALQQYPDHSVLHYLRGVALEESGQTVEAKKAYQKSVQLDPGNGEALMGLANYYYSNGKYVYAAMAFGDVVRVNPSDSESRYMQGLCYYNAGEFNRAAASWEDLLQIEPRHPLVITLLPQTYYILAVEYNRTGNASAGRKSFDNALGINPNTRQWLPGAYRTLGRYYREKGMLKESLAAYQETVELKPNDSSAYLGMGITYWRLKEPLLARTAWEKSLTLNPENNEAQGWLIIAQNPK